MPIALWRMHLELHSVSSGHPLRIEQSTLPLPFNPLSDTGDHEDDDENRAEIHS
jgi:hypothetical protein